MRIENIQPILSIKDMAVSMKFYSEALGFKAAEWGTNDFTSMNRDNSGIYLCRGAQGNPGTWIWIGFDGDMDAFYNELIIKGVKILQPPVNYSWALEMLIEDPDGHVLRFGKEPRTDEPFMDRAKTDQ